MLKKEKEILNGWCNSIKDNIEPEKPEGSPTRTCMNCGSPENIYICSEHENEFCKKCLKATYETEYGDYFLVKCKPNTECTFYPFTSQEVSPTGRIEPKLAMYRQLRPKKNINPAKERDDRNMDMFYDNVKERDPLLWEEFKSFKLANPKIQFPTIEFYRLKNGCEYY